MPDPIHAEDFIPYLGKSCQAVSARGPIFDLVIESVQEKAHLKRPQDSRTPFILLLKGPLEPSFLLGTLNLDINGALCVRNLYIARIDPPWGLDRSSAYYQAVFN